ncbi:MAG TPA: uroporphyrinogen decarboxylase family protein [Rubrivivax sp.]|nr:uroporphyrinogen decarboxylase family protein [Rubrivivax sp.]
MNAAPSLAPEAARVACDERLGRILACARLEQPDRMPVAMQSFFWPATRAGISYKDLMYDYEACKRACLDVVLEFEPDGVFPLVLGSASGRALEKLDFKQLQWPGHGVGDMQPFQYIDREYMSADEYDDFLFDPTGFYLHKYLPRVAGAFEGLDQLPVFPGLHYFRLVGGIRAFARPAVRESFERIAAAAEEADVFFSHHLDWVQRLNAAGFPLINGTNSVSPYDFIADYFRGATGMMKDLFRHKDKVKLVLNKAAVFLTRMTIANAKASGHPIVFIPIHWAPDAFMSPKQFEEFWWPPFRKMMLGLIEAELIPMPLWESDCTRRLEVIKDVPPGTCIYWFERTDMVKAFEVLGDVVALRGNLSPSLLTTGTPEQVDAGVKHLVDQVWRKGGKLILDGAFGIPDETPVANVRAMFDAARRYAG